MKIKETFVLRQVADTYVVLPLSPSSVDFNGMVTLNGSGAFLWRQMEQGATREQLAEALTKEYTVSYETALADVDAFVSTLTPVGCLEE